MHTSHLDPKKMQLHMQGGMKIFTLCHARCSIIYVYRPYGFIGVFTNKEFEHKLRRHEKLKLGIIEFGMIKDTSANLCSFRHSMNRPYDQMNIMIRQR